METIEDAPASIEETPTTAEELAKRAEACTPLQRRLLAELARNPHMNSTELARATGSTTLTVQRYMKGEPLKGMAQQARSLGGSLARSLATATMTASTGRVASAVSAYAEGLTDSDTAAVAQARLKASELTLRVGGVLTPDVGNQVTVIGTINALISSTPRPPEPWSVVDVDPKG